MEQQDKRPGLLGTPRWMQTPLAWLVLGVWAVLFLLDLLLRFLGHSSLAGWLGSVLG